MTPATTLYHIEASTMICGSGGSSNVTETEVRPGVYAPSLLYVWHLIHCYSFYIIKFKYHLCYYLYLFAILAKGTVR